MAGGPCTRLQSHLSVFLETTSVAVDEFQPLVPAFAAVLQAQMAYCGALPCPDTSHTLPADDLIGINSIRAAGDCRACREHWIPNVSAPGDEATGATLSDESKDIGGEGRVLPYQPVHRGLKRAADAAHRRVSLTWRGDQVCGDPVH